MAQPKAGFRYIQPLPQVIQPSGGLTQRQIASGGFSVGAGAISMKVDREGMYLGGDTFDASPFAVDLLGNARMTSLTLIGGLLRFGKTSFTDSVNAGYILDPNGFYIGSGNDATFLKYALATGFLDLKGAGLVDPKIQGLQQGSEIAIQGWGFTGVFSSVDDDTVSWTTGQIRLTDGSIFTIASGNTGDMTVPTYIYFDKDLDDEALQVSDDADDAVGFNKILIAVAEPNADPASEATFQVFGGGGGSVFKAENIASNTITGNEVKANTLNASHIEVGSLTADRLRVGAIPFVSTVLFSSPFADMIEWDAGQIKLVDGQSVSIDAGDTGRLQQLIAEFASDSGVDANILASLHMNETSGTTLDNAEGNAGWDGTVTNALVNQTGKFDKAVYFDGNGDYVTIADNAEMDQSTQTIEGWFKTDGVVEGRQYILSRDVTAQSPSDRYYDVYIENGYLYAIVYGYASSVYYPYVVRSASVVDDDEWHSFAVIFDATADTLSLVLDGVRQYLLPGCTNNPNASARRILLGRGDLAKTFATTAVDITNDFIVVGYYVPMGAKIRFSTTTTLPGGLSAGTDYYAITLSATTIKVATSYANALAGTSIDITSVGSGTHTITELGEFKGYLDEFRWSSSARSYEASDQLYFYYDEDEGSTLQYSATNTDAMGDGKILLAIGTPRIDVGTATIDVFNSIGTIISGDRITTGRIQSADGSTYFDLSKGEIVISNSGVPVIHLGNQPGGY